MYATRNILVVDDNFFQRKVLESILKRHYTVYTADNGQQALDIACAEEGRFELILLDIKMPDMDGYEVCRRLKALPEVRDIPVLFISGLGEGLDKVRAFEVGGRDYITKPYQGNEVLARVENQLTIARQSRRLREQNAALAKEVRQRRAAEAALEQARGRLEEVLLNTLPAGVVRELQATNHVTPVQFDDASFLFADIVSFTKLSAHMRPAEIVDWLNGIFSVFDALVEKYGLEKIRTLGDGYFVAGGLPEPRADHLQSMAALALDMQQALSAFPCPTCPEGKAAQLRIGLHCGGPVVAAVIGMRKFAYDIWGDAVNLASRMESHGAAGRIQVSAAVRERLQGDFEFEPRGVITLKGGVEQETYWLSGGGRNTARSLTQAEAVSAGPRTSDGFSLRGGTDSAPHPFLG